MTRIEKLRQKLPPGFSAAIVKDAYNRVYLTGFESSAGVLIVTEKNAYLLVDFRYYEAAKAQTADNIEVVLTDDECTQIFDIVKSSGAACAYIEDKISLAEFTRLKERLANIELVSDSVLSDAVGVLRAVKEPGEIDAIKAAQCITDAAFSYILDFLRPGLAEREIAAELDYFMKKNGADDTAFPTICLCGEKTSMPHGVPGDGVVKNGGFVTIDFGAKKNGYCSDMTRTVAVGSVSDEQKMIYDVVLTAHIAATNAARAGITGSELDKVARDIINAHGFEGCFGHGLGHSLGLEVHEEPRASAKDDSVLLPGMVMTIEPGIYIAGKFGVRIENMVAIEKSGCEQLTNSERQLIII